VTMRKRALLLLLLPFAAAANEMEAISLLYYERPPLITLQQDGHVKGLLAEPVAKIFARARLPVKWVRVPPNRAIQSIKTGHGDECTFGWHKSAEREAFASFSLPYYLDHTPVALVRTDFVVAEGSGFFELVNRPGTRLGVRENVYYGDYLQGLIESMPKENLVLLNVDNSAIARMIHARRADLTILVDDEVEPVIAEAGLSPADFQVVRLNDVAHPEYRYVVCNLRTAAKVMGRINAAIKELRLP